MAYPGYGQPGASGYGQPPPRGYPGQQQPQGGYPGQQQAQGGYPGQQQALGGYPGQQQAPGGYPGQQQASGGYPGQQQVPGGYPGQQQAPGGYPGQQQAPSRGYPVQQPGGYPSQGQPAGCPPGVDPTVYSWFVAVDADHSGQISSMELQSALTNGNWSNFNQETCRLMIGIFDRDNNGTIDIKEFQQLWSYINQWKGVFDRYDRDRSGNIDAKELYTAYNEMGFRVTENFCRLVVTRFDRLAKRSLKFDDFIQSCVMLRSLSDAFKTRDTNLNGIIQVNYEDFMTMAIANKP